MLLTKDFDCLLAELYQTFLDLLVYNNILLVFLLHTKEVTLHSDFDTVLLLEVLQLTQMLLLCL